MKYWKFIFIHILQSTVVYASIETQQHGRKHSTAHYFPNGTVYILGGIEFRPNATETQFASSNTLLFNKKDFSLHSTSEKTLSIPATIGHTSHVHVPSNTIISVFGMQSNHKESPPLIPNFKQKQTLVPKGRYKHSSILLNNDLYVIGGELVTNNLKLIESQDIIWNYSFSTHTWKHISTTNISSMAGHISLVYNQWIISCFGHQSKELLLNSCTWFDTNTFNSTVISPTHNNADWPTARTYANIISVGNNDHILFGGEKSQDTILNDLWKLHIDSAFNMIWKKINYKTINNNSYSRSGHASALLGNENIVLYYGGQSDPKSLATDPIYLDLSKMEWIHTKNNSGLNVIRNDVNLNETSENHSNMNGGTIAGIIVGVIAVVALSIGFLIWKKRVKRQQNIHKQSRAARFSQSPTPMHSIENHNSNHSSLQTSANKTNFLSLPELALSRESSKSRISAISLGAEFRISSDDYRRSHLSRDSAILGDDKRSTIPKIELKQESIEEEPLRDYKRRESTGFKRLTLNLFSSSQDEPKKKDRSSSLFQLRASKYLQPVTPNTPDGKFPSKVSPLHSRVSLGAKSVSSIQWVGFNDSMDYKRSNWRDSSTSSMHLAVTNAQRASSHYTTDSAQSTPRSPMFPSHLRDSAAHYQLSESESNSWKSNVNTSSSSTNL